MGFQWIRPKPVALQPEQYRVMRGTPGYRMGRPIISDPGSDLWFWPGLTATYTGNRYDGHNHYWSGLHGAQFGQKTIPTDTIQPAVASTENQMAVRMSDGRKYWCHFLESVVGGAYDDAYIEFERSSAGHPRNILHAYLNYEDAGWTLDSRIFTMNGVRYTIIDTEGITGYRMIVSPASGGIATVQSAGVDAGDVPVLWAQLGNNQYVAVALTKMSTEHFIDSAWQNPQNDFDTNPQSVSNALCYMGLGATGLTEAGDTIVMALAYSDVQATAIANARQGAGAAYAASELADARALWDDVQDSGRVMRTFDPVEDYYCRVAANQIVAMSYEQTATATFLPASLTTQQIDYLRDTSLGAMGLAEFDAARAAKILRWFAEVAQGTILDVGWWAANGIDHGDTITDVCADSAGWFVMAAGATYNLLPAADRAAFRTAILTRLTECYDWFASKWDVVPGHLNISPHPYHDWTDDAIVSTTVKYEADLDIIWGEAWLRAAVIFQDAEDAIKYAAALGWGNALKASIEDYAITAGGGLAYAIDTSDALYMPGGLIYTNPNASAAFYWGREASYDYLMEHQRLLGNSQLLFPSCQASRWDAAGTAWEACMRREWLFGAADLHWGAGEGFRALVRQWVMPEIPRDIQSADQYGGWALVEGGGFPYPMQAGVSLTTIYAVQSWRRW